MRQMQHVGESVVARKDAMGLTWEQVGAAIGKSPVYAAMLCYGYGAATVQEANALGDLLDLDADVRKALTEAPQRTPAGPWPPTDPFIYRFYEVVMLYGPVLKDVCHELFGDGIMSAIDMSIDIQKVKGAEGEDRAQVVLNGKWLKYKKF